MRHVVACFGEVLLRYAPRCGTTLRDTDGLGLHVGGAEANVAVGLANLGFVARMISTLPANDLGTLARKRLRAEGVDVAGMGEGAGRMGVYYATPAIGLRAGQVLYDRDDSAFSLCQDYAFEALLDGVTHLHVSGISLAVSEQASAATRKLAHHAKDLGLTVSVDGNYRPSLWDKAGRNPRPEIAELVANADLFFGNHKDVALLFGKEFSGDGPERRREAALAALDHFEGLTVVASTARHVDGNGTHHIVARMDTISASAESAAGNLTNVVDRIGTGDAFAAGVLSGWLEDRNNLSDAVQRGMSLAALKHYTPGDFSLANAAELASAMKGAGDVAR